MKHPPIPQLRRMDHTPPGPQCRDDGDSLDVATTPTFVQPARTRNPNPWLWQATQKKRAESRRKQEELANQAFWEEQAQVTPSSFPSQTSEGTKMREGPQLPSYDVEGASATLLKNLRGKTKLEEREAALLEYAETAENQDEASLSFRLGWDALEGRRSHHRVASFCYNGQCHLVEKGSTPMAYSKRRHPSPAGAPARGCWTAAATH